MDDFERTVFFFFVDTPVESRNSVNVILFTKRNLENVQLAAAGFGVQFIFFFFLSRSPVKLFYDKTTV